MKPYIILMLSLLCAFGVGQAKEDPDVLFSSECKDQQDWCSTVVDYCEDHTVIVPLCRKTCNKCEAGNKKPGTDSSGGLDEDCKSLKCEHKCEKMSKNKYVCRCREGYELSEDNKSCRDIDECANGNPCSGDNSKCVNTEGSYQCEKLCGSNQLNYYGGKGCCDLTNGKCGRNSANGGFEADGKDAIVTRWPWMSLITVKSTNKECGGILVSNTWILAAAHCFDNALYGDIHAYFGIINTSKQTGIKDYSQGRRVDRVVIHPKYDYPSYDVALVSVTRAVEMTKYVGITCLPQNEFPPTGQKCWATGYAAIPTRDEVTRDLQQETVEVVDKKRCQSSPKKLNLDPSMMCIAHGNRTAPEECQGSAGGPLVCQRCSSCDWYVAGLASAGISCTFDKTFSAFTSVSVYENWIRQVMGLERLRQRKGAACQVPGKGTTEVIEWREWEAWSRCSASCGNGTSFRRRTCKGGNPGEDGCTGKSEEARLCEDRPCPGWGTWGEWSACTMSCRAGKRFRSRECINGKIGRKGCMDNARESERCNVKPCPTWGPWQKWAKCNVSCGKGAQISQRQCVNGIAGDKGCKGRNTKSKLCRMPKCPSWTSWGRWSKCSQTCDGGMKVSKRRCVAGKRLSTGCEGNATRSQACNERQCRGCSAWTTWSSCSVSCGPGSQDRRRDCILKKGTKSVRDWRPCRGDRCVASWTGWSGWSECSATCGGGVETRGRNCSRQGTRDCRGTSAMTRSCNTQGCTPHNVWSEWGSWGPCDAKCGEGTRVRYRDCQTEKCLGRPLDEESCFSKCGEEEACAEFRDVADYCEMSAPWCSLQPGLLWGRCDKTCCTQEYRFAYSEWSSWNACSKTCGGGQQSRLRDCESASSCAKFKQALEETRRCRTQDCSFRSAALCSASCGGGFRQAKCLGTECGNDGEFAFERCNTQPCQQSFSTWGEWGPCSTTCGLGNKKRERYCKGAKESCDGELEQIEECKVADCIGTWSAWGDWGLCSVSCGIGTIKRSRTCMDGDCAGSGLQQEACVTFDCPVVTSTCEDEASMQYLCQFLTGHCDNDYMKYACRKTCRIC